MFDIATGVTLRQHVTKYKNMRKWMVKYLRKFENHEIKSGRDNSILITKINQFSYLLSFCTVLAVRCDVDTFTLTATGSVLTCPFIEKSMIEVITNCRIWNFFRLNFDLPTGTRKRINVYRHSFCTINFKNAIFHLCVQKHLVNMKYYLSHAF